jgi:hypothetical protein
MQAYTDFILQVTYPPNPIANIVGGENGDVAAGRSFFNGPVSDTLLNCDGCHTLDPQANAQSNVDKPGFFGGDGRSSFEGETQHLKIPHLRNMYQKVGMFGLSAAPLALAPGDDLFTGDQVRGFGFLHDGSVDTLFRFHGANAFVQSPTNPTGIPPGAAGIALRRQIDAFMMAFDSNLLPIVGQQATHRSGMDTAVDMRVDLLKQSANFGHCDLVAKRNVDGEPRGYLFAGSDVFISDRASEPPVTAMAMRSEALTAGQEVTYTCVPPGSGVRIGIDRDGDGYGDRDELDQGSDPEDAGSTPSGVPQVCTSTNDVLYKTAKIDDRAGKLTLTAKDLYLQGYAQEPVTASISDPNGPVYAGTVPGASFILKGSTYKFTAPSGATGIIRASVKQNRRAPGWFLVKVKTKLAWPAGSAVFAEPLTVVQLNVGGRCFFGNATKIRH